MLEIKDQLPDRAELEQLLQNIYRESPNEVILFVSRCAFRHLPLLVDSDGNPAFESHLARHILSIFRAIWCAFRRGEGCIDQVADEPTLQISSQTKNAASAATSKLAFSLSNLASAAAEIPLKKVNPSDDGIHEISQAASYIIQLENEVFCEVGRMYPMGSNEDFAMLSDHDSLKMHPLWSSSPDYIGGRTLTFSKWLRENSLGILIGDYSRIFLGDTYRLLKNSWDRYEDSWRKLEWVYENEFHKHHFRSESENEPHETSPPNEDNQEKPEDAEDLQDILRLTPSLSFHCEGPAQNDHLNRQPLVNALAKWLQYKENTGHLALGLFGDWGVGKTTFVNLLRDKLQNKLTQGKAEREEPIEYIYGEFNAWSYEHCGNIQAGLAQEFVNSCVSAQKPFSRFVLVLKFVGHQHPWQGGAFFTSILAALALMIYGYCHPEFLGVLTEYLGINGGFLGGIVLIAVLYSRGKKILAHPLAKDLRTYLRLPDFGEELGKLPVMREQIKALSTLCLGNQKNKQRRLLFVVDDLDRCSPEGVVKTLEAVRLAMDLEHVVVIIAIDQKVALASLALHYEKLAEHHNADPISIARDYLGKVIHLPLRLERPSDTEVEAYMRKLWQPSEDVSEVGSDMSTATPKLNNTEANTSKGASRPDLKTLSGGHNVRDKDVTSIHHEQSPPESDLQQPEVELESEGLDSQPGMSQSQETLFIEWLHKLEISNPRRLKRLDNSYNLIRLRYPEEDQNVGGHPRLLMLLWLEYLGELGLSVRQQATDLLQGDEVATGDLRGIVKARFEDFKKEIKGESGIPLSQLYLQINPYVLPAVEKAKINVETNQSKTKLDSVVLEATE